MEKTWSEVFCSAGVSGAMKSIAGAAAGAGATHDLEDLLRRLMGNRALARKVIAKCLDSLPVQLEQGRRALEAEKAEEAQRMAHTVKGVALNFAAEPLEEAARRAETAAERGQWAEIREAWAAVEAEAVRLLGALRGTLAEWDEGAGGVPGR